MPDDFQALPPPGLPADNGLPPTPASDRMADVNIRKPEKEGASRARIIAIAVMLFFVLFCLLAFCRLPTRVARPYHGEDSPTVSGVPLGPVEISTVFDGTWFATAMTIDGEKTTDDDVKQVKLQMTSMRRFRLDLPNKSQTGYYFGLDERIEFFSDDAGRLVIAIYKQDGDALTICLHEAERPTDFTAEKGSGRTLIVLKKRKPEPIAAPSLIEGK